METYLRRLTMQNKHQELLERGDEARVESERLAQQFIQNGGKIHRCKPGHRTILRLKFGQL